MTRYLSPALQAEGDQIVAEANAALEVTLNATRELLGEMDRTEMILMIMKGLIEIGHTSMTAMSIAILAIRVIEAEDELNRREEGKLCAGCGSPAG